MKGRYQSIPLTNIITSARLQNRNTKAPIVRHRAPLTPSSFEHLDDLKQAISQGVRLPPVQVVKAEADKGGRFYLVDGFHRFWAHEQLKKKVIAAEVLDGCGIAHALIAAGRANLSHGLRLDKHQRAENAWRCLNLPESDHFRRLNKTEAAGALGVSSETIKKMRKNIRKRGVEAGLINSDLSGSAGEEALQAYWDEHPAPDTWRDARRGTTPTRKGDDWKVQRAGREIAQLLVSLAEAYGPEVMKSAHNAVGFHLRDLKPAEGVTKLTKAFSVTPKPLLSDDEAAISTEAMAGFLEWQQAQGFDHDPKSLFNDVELEDSSSDF
ncbi:ParB-like nuclease domain-containing protein [Atopomonas hussainii]|uniref:ParB-like nuclease domain-containing protein n=1 Tax=Atopomonas hussainii TaxID=1429083 RepID=A0A1H7SRD3_9GAMM|nr:ParB/RepB/Spo0J family partition protein [Atopomonas hussainii]SEL74444.1 ParB-like nuclease domain-containing protein [Atopomonas hussainii]